MADSLTVLISGASGFIGSELVRQLASEGHTVRTLVRHPPTKSSETQWDPDSGSTPPGAFDGVDAVVNLSGASTGRIPWTAKYKKLILSSRVNSTATLAKEISSAARPPAVFLNGSAVGFYRGSTRAKCSPRSRRRVAATSPEWWMRGRPPRVPSLQARGS